MFKHNHNESQVKETNKKSLNNYFGLLYLIFSQNTAVFFLFLLVAAFLRVNTTSTFHYEPFKLIWHLQTFNETTSDPLRVQYTSSDAAFVMYGRTKPQHSAQITKGISILRLCHRTFLSY